MPAEKTFKKSLWIPALGQSLTQLSPKVKLTDSFKASLKSDELLFEEVAGITKFKLRKKESLKED